MNKIIDPIGNNTFDIHSESGRLLLKQYIRKLTKQGGYRGLGYKCDCCDGKGYIVKFCPSCTDCCEECNMKGNYVDRLCDCVKKREVDINDLTPCSNF